jgi:hypothetical protein
MPERTVLLLTGNALVAVAAACRMARELAPAMLVLEDVDLVAEDRTRGQSTSVLFELLNQMDGLGEDTDVVFVLTTNRPEVIELQLELRDQASFIAATAGTTPAFIREALRRAALLAAERGDGTRITDELLSSGIQELREGADQLTGSLLGAQPAASAGR